VEKFNYLDIIVIVLVTLLGLKGLLTGFIKEVFSLLGIIGGVFLASRFSKDVGIFVNDNIFTISNSSALSATGFVISFLVFFIIVYMFGALIQKIVASAGLGVFDKIGGMIIGGSKIFLIFSIIAFGLNSVEAIKKNIESKVENSIMFPILVNTGSYIVKLNPDELVEDINDGVEKVRENLQDGIKSSTNNIKDNMSNIGQ
jgi:membrane protein required for colicin V production